MHMKCAQKTYEIVQKRDSAVVHRHFPTKKNKIGYLHMKNKYLIINRES